jgi:predicted ester cyclase
VSPDSTIEVEDVFDAGDAVVSVLARRGTYGGPMGDVPPTGKPFTLRGVRILRFDERGEIVTHDNFFDQLSFLVQLGLMEAPA